MMIENQPPHLRSSNIAIRLVAGGYESTWTEVWLDIKMMDCKVDC